MPIAGNFAGTDVEMMLHEWRCYRAKPKPCMGIGNITPLCSGKRTLHMHALQRLLNAAAKVDLTIETNPHFSIETM